MSYIAREFNTEIVELLKSGGIGFMPSDTIYGLTCRALDEKAVVRLRSLKSRSEYKPLIVLFSNLEQLADLGMPSNGLEKALEYWPGPLSLEWDARRSPTWLHPASDTFAIRMPDKPELIELINKIGPITSTSANPEGAEPAKSVKEAENYFGKRLDFYVDVGEITHGVSSTLARLVDGQFEILRQGAIYINQKEIL
jgi:L-threonylcarbamoyladenylate synthase